MTDHNVEAFDAVQIGTAAVDILSELQTEPQSELFTPSAPPHVPRSTLRGSCLRCLRGQRTFAVRRAVRSGDDVSR